MDAHLRLWISKSTVELEHFGAVSGQHDASVEDTCWKETRIKATAHLMALDMSEDGRQKGRTESFSRPQQAIIISVQLSRLRKSLHFVKPLDEFVTIAAWCWLYIIPE